MESKHGLIGLFDGGQQVNTSPTRSALPEAYRSLIRTSAIRHHHSLDNINNHKSNGVVLNRWSITEILIDLESPCKPL